MKFYIHLIYLSQVTEAQINDYNKECVIFSCADADVSYRQSALNYLVQRFFLLFIMINAFTKTKIETVTKNSLK